MWEPSAFHHQLPVQRCSRCCTRRALDEQDANPVILSPDEFALWSMSCREDSETGIDACNADTFGDDADQSWSYEQQCAANAALAHACLARPTRHRTQLAPCPTTWHASCLKRPLPQPLLLSRTRFSSLVLRVPRLPHSPQPLPPLLTCRRPCRFHPPAARHPLCHMAVFS